MICLYCGGETDVINSRLQRRSNQIWRRRRCQKCQAVFTTHETAELSGILRVDRLGVLEPFLPDMLFSELLHTLQHRKDAYAASREASATITKRLLDLPTKPVFTPSQISTEAAKVLKRLDRRAYLRYLADHPSLQ